MFSACDNTQAASDGAWAMVEGMVVVIVVIVLCSSPSSATTTTTTTTHYHYLFNLASRSTPSVFPSSPSLPFLHNTINLPFLSLPPPLSCYHLPPSYQPLTPQAATTTIPYHHHHFHTLPSLPPQPLTTTTIPLSSPSSSTSLPHHRLFHLPPPST